MKKIYKSHNKFEGSNNLLTVDTIISEKSWNDLFLTRIGNFKSPFSMFQELSFICTNNKKAEHDVFDDNKLHHVRMTWDGNNVTTFIDNKEVKSPISDKIIKGWKKINLI